MLNRAVMLARSIALRLAKLTLKPEQKRVAHTDSGASLDLGLLDNSDGLVF